MCVRWLSALGTWSVWSIALYCKQGLFQSPFNCWHEIYMWRKSILSSLIYLTLVWDTSLLFHPLHLFALSTQQSECNTLLSNACYAHTITKNPICLGHNLESCPSYVFLVCDGHVRLVISTALQKVRKPEKVIHSMKVCILFIVEVQHLNQCFLALWPNSCSHRYSRGYSCSSWQQTLDHSAQYMGETALTIQKVSA